jgi:hypothetical protein
LASENSLRVGPRRLNETIEKPGFALAAIQENVRTGDWLAVFIHDSTRNGQAF